MHEVISIFEQYLTHEKRYSSHTVRAYIDDLNQFSDFAASTYDINTIAEIKPAFVRTWLGGMKEEGITSKTINRKISSLKSFFKHLLKIGLVAQSPMQHITAPKINKRLPQYVSTADIGHLLFHLQFPETYIGVLEKTILFTFYYTGMRLSELQNLLLTDVNTSASTLKVLGKGNKERIIPMSAELNTQIKLYIAARKEIMRDLVEPFLFVNEKQKPLYARFIYKVVNTYLQQVTTIDKKSPHILRHSFATHLTNNGAELNAVKELLGHASLAATQIYTHNSIEKLKNAYNKAHPKA